MQIQSMIMNTPALRSCTRAGKKKERKNRSRKHPEPGVSIYQAEQDADNFSLILNSYSKRSVLTIGITDNVFLSQDRSISSYIKVSERRILLTIPLVYAHYSGQQRRADFIDFAYCMYFQSSNTAPPSRFAFLVRSRMPVHRYILGLTPRTQQSPASREGKDLLRLLGHRAICRTVLAPTV